MSCINFGNAIVCISSFDTVRFHVGNKYIWMDFHRYCGPSFWKDRLCTIEYSPGDENDPVWEHFNKWYDKNKTSLKV